MSSDNKLKIKVLRIIARLNIGGPAMHTVLLTEGLDKDKFESILVAGRVDGSEGDMRYYAQKKNVSPVIIPQLQRKINLFNDFIAFLKIYRLIKREKPDIIHTHTAKAGALGRLAGVLYNIGNQENKCKLIHTFHGTVLEGYFGKIKSKIFIWIERVLAYFTDWIIVVSETVKDELLKLKIGAPDKLCVVPLGLELQGLLSLSSGRNDSALKAGIVGRLVPIKNHRLFLEAIGLFLKDFNLDSISFRFFIIGDGELRRELEEYAFSLGINKFVKFCGWYSEIAEIYAPLDVVVLTSLNEGTPVSLIEAMSAAKPVIATEVGGVQDLFIKSQNYGFDTSDRIGIYDNGILFKSGDAIGLAKALNLLFAHADLRAKMGNAARAFVKDRFSKERLIRDIEMLYNNCFKKE